MPRFIYDIRPEQLVNDDTETVFERDLEYKIGDVFEHGGRELFVESVSEEVLTKWETQPDSMTIARTLHCRLVTA